MSEAKIVVSAEDRTKAVFAGLRANLGLTADQAGKLNNGFAALGATGGVIAALTAMGAFVRSVSSGIDRMNDLKDATGASIENISALEDTAKRTGSSFETVEASLIKLNSVLKDASPGSEQAKVLASIGLSAEELKRIDPAEALLKTAKALNGYADDGNKARLTQYLFGKSLKDTAPFLKDLAEKGELVATTTTRQAEEAEKFNKQLAEFRVNSENAARAITMTLVPALNELYNRIKDNGGLGASAAASLRVDAVSFAKRDLEMLEANIAEKGRIAADIKEAMDKDRKNNLPENRAYVQAYAAAKAELKLLQDQAVASSEALKSVADKLAPPFMDVYSNERDRRSKPSTKDVSLLTAKPESAAEREQKNYEALLKTVQERLDLSSEELRLGRELTEDEKFRTQVTAALLAKKLDPGHQKVIERIRDEAVENIKLNFQRAEGLRLTARDTQETANRAQALDAEVRLLREQNEEIGLSASLLEKLKLSRSAEVIAREQERLIILAGFGLGKLEQQQLQANIDLLRELLKLRTEGRAKSDEIASDPTRGAKAAIDDYLKTVERSGDATRDAFANSLKGAEDALVSFFQTGKLDAAKFADSVIAEILRISLVRPLIGEAAKFIGSFLGIKGFADGGAFLSSGEVRAFATGGVFNEPTYFKYGGGKHAGVLGEAGPEAIMPLARGAGGELGIISHGGGQPQVTNNNFYQVGSNISRAEVMGALQLLADSINTRTDAKLARAGIR